MQPELCRLAVFLNHVHDAGFQGGGSDGGGGGGGSTSSSRSTSISISNSSKLKRVLTISPRVRDTDHETDHEALS